MKNLTLHLLICMFLLSSFGISQKKSLLRNKLALAYDISYKVSSVFTNDNYSLSDVGLTNLMKYSAKEHSITANYKLLPRMSVSLVGGFINNRFYLSNFSYYNQNPSVKIASAKSISYGVGINLFFKKGLAPSDSHLGFFIKKYNYKLKEENVVDAVYIEYLSLYPEGKKITAKGDAEMNITYVGVKYNYTRMVSKNLPIFWNAGINLLIPVTSKMTLSEVTITEPDNYYYENFNGYSNHTLMMENLKKQNIFKVNMGIGYIF